MAKPKKREPVPEADELLRRAEQLAGHRFTGHYGVIALAIMTVVRELLDETDDE